MTRLQSHPGLTSGPGFTEFAYATGSTAWPVARVRVRPVLSAAAPREYPPNAPTLPQRVEVLMSASLVDAAGQVLAIGGLLLVGPETRHTRQFDADAPFDPAAWLDGAAAQVIAPLIRLAEGMAAAAAAGLLPGSQPPVPEEPAGE